MDETYLNEKRSDTVLVACVCSGRNPACVQCDGIGAVKKPACKRCGGTGHEGPRAKCIDCRGHGWRELDLL